MMYQRIRIAAVSSLFLLVYYASSYLFAWLDVYVFNHWDSKFGSDLSFKISLVTIKFFTAIASLGLAFGLYLRWDVALRFSLMGFAVVMLLAAVVSSVSLWVMVILDVIPDHPGFILMHLFFVPCLSMIGGLRLFDKENRQQHPLPNAV